MRCLNLERLCIAASGAGNCQRIVDYATDYARERVQFGQAIGRFQAVGHKLADMQIFFRASRIGPIGGGSNESQRNIIARLMGR